MPEKWKEQYHKIEKDVKSLSTDEFLSHLREKEDKRSRFFVRAVTEYQKTHGDTRSYLEISNDEPVYKEALRSYRKTTEAKQAGEIISRHELEIEARCAAKPLAGGVVRVEGGGVKDMIARFNRSPRGRV